MATFDERWSALDELGAGLTRYEPTQDLRAYIPTWRERIGGWLMGDGGGGQARRDFVAGLVGSTGLPNTARSDTAGLSLADILPVAGGVLGVNDALREGDDPRAAANAVTAVAPLAAPLLRGVIAAAPKTTAAVAGALGATMTPTDAGTRLTREQRQQLEVERQRLEAQRQAAEAEARMRAQTDMERQRAEAEFQRQRAVQDAELQRQMEAQRRHDAEDVAARSRDAEARMPFRERYPTLASALPFAGAAAAFGFPAAVKAGKTLYNNRAIGRWERAVDQAAEAQAQLNDAAMRRYATDLADILMGGAPATAGRGAAHVFGGRRAQATGNHHARDLQTINSRAGLTYDPPQKAQRSFTEDYRAGVPGNAGPGQPLTHDMDGRPLGARWVVGRKVVGGPDEAFPRLTSEYDAVGTQIVGRPHQKIPRKSLELSGDDGLFLPALGGKKGVILVADDLDDAKRMHVIQHEIAHAIDHATRPAASAAEFNSRRWGIRHHPDDDYLIEDQLYSIYRDLNRPAVGPADLGYPRQDRPRELWAEAIRAYLINPNYIKSVAPQVAAAIRKAVNEHPELSKIIQFNAILLPVALGALKDRPSSDPLADTLDRE